MSEKLISKLRVSLDNVRSTYDMVWRHIASVEADDNDIEFQLHVWNILRELERKIDKLKHYIEQLRPDWSKTLRADVPRRI